MSSDNTLCLHDPTVQMRKSMKTDCRGNEHLFLMIQGPIKHTLKERFPLIPMGTGPDPQGTDQQGNEQLLTSMGVRS